MKRSIRAVLATSAAVALTGLGVAPAAATDDPKPDHPSEYMKVDEKYTIPAYYACKDPIKVHEVFKYRFTVLKENKHHAKYKEELHHGYAKFYNPKTHRWVKIPIHETFYIHENRKNWTANAKGYGKSYLQGNGIKGIVAWKGEIKVKVSNVDDPPNLKFEIKKVDGHYKQLCYQLGTKPVWGKNVNPPA
jgi:hypothetical protein